MSGATVCDRCGRKKAARSGAWSRVSVSGSFTRYDRDFDLCDRCTPGIVAALTKPKCGKTNVIRHPLRLVD